MKRARRPAIRAIFFDFDGVLVDSEPLHYACWRKVLASRGIRLSWGEYRRRMIGVSNRQMVRELCGETGRTYSDQLFEEWYAEKKRLYFARVARCRVPRALVACLRRLRLDYALGVVSSSARREVEPTLVRQGIRGWLTTVICSEDVKKLKPAPDAYRRALAMVNARSRRRIRAAECLVVEDSGPGVEAARRARMRVVRVAGPRKVARAVRGELHAMGLR